MPPLISQERVRGDVRWGESRPVVQPSSNRPRNSASPGPRVGNPWMDGWMDR